jgi:chromosome segregation ATPase
MDLNQTSVMFSSDLYRTPTKVQTLGERLAELRYQLHIAGSADVEPCSKLVTEYFGLEKRIEEFFSECQSRRIATLEAKRADLWAKCRRAENATRNLLQESGKLNASLNASAMELNDCRQKTAEASRKPFDTQFPTEAESATWVAKASAAQRELRTVEDRHQEIARELQFTRHEHADASRALAELVEQLRALDSVLKAKTK